MTSAAEVQPHCLITEETFRTRDGVQLHVRLGRPSGPAKGTILWVHGGCEHGGRHDHVITRFAAAGWSIVLPDHRGHGRSEGERTDIDRCETYLNDLIALQEKYCPNGRAEVVFGHSFGGLLALRLAQTDQQPQAMVLSAPLIRLLLPVPWWKRAAGEVLVRVSPRVRFRTHINPRNMTRDPAFLERRLADPLLLRSVTVRWFFAMQRCMQQVHRDAARLSCPMLAIQGSADRTVDPTALPGFLERTNSNDREVRVFPDHVHELLQESDWEQTAALILDWLAQRFPVASPPPTIP